jgi:hypothetical protein
MTVSLLLIIQAILCGIRGVGFIFAPEKLWMTFKIQLNGGTIIPAQILGAAYLGIVAMNLHALQFLGDSSLASILLFNMVFELISALVTLVSIYQKTLDRSGWVPFTIHLLLAIGFCYFLMS